MKSATQFLSLLLLAVVAFLGCSGADEPYRKKVYPVTGKLVVNGAAPGSPLQIGVKVVSEADSEHPSMSTAESLPDGTFQFSTYAKGDGVPEGEYVLTVTWSEVNAMSRSLGPDKFNGAYADPATSEIKLSVKDQPVNLGDIQLTAADTTSTSEADLSTIRIGGE